VLLPAAATDEKSLLARLERLESAGRGRSAPVPQAPPRPPYSGQDDDAERSRAVSPAPRPVPEAGGSPASRPPAPKQPAPVQAAPQERTAGSPGLSAADSLRTNWDAVLEAVKQERRVAWMLLSNASVLSLADGILTLRFPRDGDLKGFSVSGHDAVLKRVLSADFGLNVTVKGVAGGDAPAGAPAGRPGGSGPSNPASSPSRQPAAAPPEFAPPDPAGYDDPPDDVPPDEMPPDEPSPADRAVRTTELTGMDLIQRELGGQVIGEIDG
jgi:DNA polymerase III subunit gamma/tau